MNRCPVCGKENTGFVCSDCGFDLSCDFERLPTLSMVKSGSLSCSKLKIVREAKFKNVKRCEVCGGYTFYFDEEKYILTCPVCGKVIKLEKAKKRNKITAVAAGDYHTVVLKEDGTAAAIGNNYSGQCSVGSWKNLAAVYAGCYHTIGLKKDGHVVATGDNSAGQCNVEDWYGIISAAAGYGHTVGLRRDGTVLITKNIDYGQSDVEKLI